MHTFVYGLLGGALIGLSASTLLLGAGEILGASGIVSSIGLSSPLASLRDARQHWKLVLLASFCVTSNLFFAPIYQDYQNGLASLSPYAFLLGGFLVGFGTKLGNGCTSGHGICGLARFSKRSLVSVCTFMAIGVVTAVLTQPATTGIRDDAFKFLRNQDPTSNSPITTWSTKVAAVVVFLLALMALIAPSFQDDSRQQDYSSLSIQNCHSKLAPAAVAGVLFASGLYLSRMVYPTVVLGFLNVALMPRGEWNATLMFVMGGGLIISAASYQMVQGYTFDFVLKCLPSNIRPLSRPLCVKEDSNAEGESEDRSSKFCIPTNQIIDHDLVLGAAVFGIGWGISGLCPGPAMVLASIGVAWVLVCYWPAFFLGAFLATHVKGRQCGCRCSTRQGLDDNASSKSHTSSDQGSHLHAPSPVDKAAKADEQHGEVSISV